MKQIKCAFCGRNHLLEKCPDKKISDGQRVKLVKLPEQENPFDQDFNDDHMACIKTDSVYKLIKRKERLLKIVENDIKKKSPIENANPKTAYERYYLGKKHILEEILEELQMLLITG